MVTIDAMTLGFVCVDDLKTAKIIVHFNLFHLQRVGKITVYRGYK